MTDSLATRRLAKETELRTLLEASPDPMARFDRQLRYTYVNPAAQVLAGAPHDGSAWAVLTETALQRGRPDAASA